TYAKDSTHRSMKIILQGGHRDAYVAVSHNPANGSFAPLAFQPSAMTNCGKTNLSHEGLNLAHVPYWRVNNPTLGEFYFTIQLSLWNSSNASSFEFRRSKESLGHAFMVHIRTGNQNQMSFYPSVPHEISVLVELILGHISAREASLGSKNRGSAPLPIHEISKIMLKVVVFYFRLSAPTYTTPLKSLHKVELESSSKGRTIAKAFAKDVFINQERKIDGFCFYDSTVEIVFLLISMEPYEKSKFLGSGEYGHKA
ncbi:hypothetical protein H5410_005516, partial [Solanum commersonii]